MRQLDIPNNAPRSQTSSAAGIRHLLLAVAAAALVSCQTAPSGPVVQRFGGNNSLSDAAAAGYSTSDEEMQMMSDMVEVLEARGTPMAPNLKAQVMAWRKQK